MTRDAKNIVPITMAVLLHVVLLTSMVVAFDHARPAPNISLAITATLVTEVPEFKPPPVTEPEPEPEIIEPLPEPDNSEELRRAAEEEKRRLDALLEKQRLEEIRRRQREEADRRKREEERKEVLRKEAERKRLADIERQRRENERQRRELEDEHRQAEIDAESIRLAAVDSGALAVYMTQIRQKIERNWSAPASAGADLECSVRVRQIPGGEVIRVTILSCNGDEAVRRSVEAAIHLSSPLPEPSDPSLFDRNILLNLSIRQ
ncbi:MAG: cell envelope integrity protein TolA [Proteobacteria bacterium]|nr:cell envelope integrity protein TolA [Pseudomonadota bacterium]